MHSRWKRFLILILALAALYQFGCADQKDNVLPFAADFAASPTSGKVPLTVHFTDMSTGHITSREWDFQNDGIVDATTRDATWIYPNCGEYTVSLKVTGVTGTDTEVKENYITVHEEVIYVNGTTGDDANNGLSRSSALKTIQRGLDLAGDNWLVLVADGTYTGTSNKELDFSGKAIHLKSAGGAPKCIIDCEDEGHGFHFHSGESSDAVVDGFTIQNSYLPPTSPEGGGAIFCGAGSSPTIRNCILRDSYGGGWAGGGIYCLSSNPTITNCHITDNYGVFGGGIYCFSSSPTITDCTITGNGACDGGGIYCYESSPTIANCTISNNDAPYGGGGIYCIGGSSPTIANCTITGNIATHLHGEGGGICCKDLSCPVIINCTIANNETGDGGGICCFNFSNPMIINCEITNNLARYYGGGISSWGVSCPTITNCTIANNQVEYRSGGGIFCRRSYAIVNNTILWSNTACTSGNEIHTDDADSSVSLNYCCYADNTLDSNNIAGSGIVSADANCITADPLFIDPANGDYHVAAGSPCIDAGASEFASNNYDLDGNVRLNDGDNDGTVTVDIGAYEFRGPGNDAPIVVTQSAPEGVIQDSAPIFTYVGSDMDGSVVGYRVSIDANPPDIPTTDTTWTSAPLSPGTYTFYVQAQDDNGAWSVISSCTFVYDPTPEVRSVPAEYLTIQEAIDSTGDGDAVVVADGIYTGIGNVGLSFRGKSITVKSENGAANCVIDGEGRNSGFSLRNGETNEAVIDGFTVQNAGSDGGIYCWRSSPTITNCIIKDNNNCGIQCLWDSTPVITDCVIADNETNYVGGGVYCDHGSSPTIVNCIISGNTSHQGGGIGCESSPNITISNCVIMNNHADWGGGISCGGSGATITNCIVANNSARWGGGVDCSNAVLTNCTIAYNTSTETGGGLHIGGRSGVTLNNTVIWGNSASLQGNQIYVYHSDNVVTLNNCNYAGQAGDIEGDGTITPINCISLDPLFVNAGAQDYHLQAGSPCINAGDNSLVPPGITTDLDGRPRIINGIVDIGAYEE